MDRKTIHNKVHIGLLQAIAFTLPFDMRLNNALVFLCLLNWLAEGKIWSKTRQAFSNPVALLMLAFFLLHIVSAAYSSNTREAWAIVERRLPLLVFPLLVFDERVATSHNKILLWFCRGVVLACLICLGVALYRYVGMGSYDPFFYHYLSSAISINAVYLSAYAVLAVIILLNRQLNIAYIACICLLAFFCVLLSSKMMLCCLLIYLTVHLFKRVKNSAYKKAWAGILLIVCILIILIPGVRNRFANEFSSKFNLLAQSRYNYDTPFTGISLRLVLWKQSIGILNEERAWLAGTGSGDFQDKLNERYRETGMYTGDGKKDTGYLGYGPHNQYIEVLLYAGIAGLLLFLALLVVQLTQANAHQNWLAGAFIVLCMVFFTSESVLSTNKGIIFFSLFSALFFVHDCLTRNSNV